MRCRMVTIRALREHRPSWRRKLITPILLGFSSWRVILVIQIIPKIKQLSLVSLQSYPEIFIKLRSYLLLSNGQISNWISDSQHYDPDHHQNLITCFFYHPRPSIKLHRYQFLTLWVMLLTDKHTKRQTDKQTQCYWQHNHLAKEVVMLCWPK